MLTEVGRVVAVDVDALWVETIRKSTCGTCAAQKGCGHGLLNQAGVARQNYVRVLPGDCDLGQCRVDDQVVISLPEEVILRGSAIAYVLPLLCMLAMAVSAVALLPIDPDAAAALGTIAGLVLGFGLVRWHSARHRDDTSFQPTLVQVQPQPPVGIPVTVN